MKPLILSLLSAFMLVNSAIGQIEVNPKLLSQIKNKYLSFTAEDMDGKPQSLQFKFVYNQTNKTLKLESVKGSFEEYNFDVTSDNDHSLKKVDGNELTFTGNVLASKESNQSQYKSEIKITFDSASQSKKINTWCTLSFENGYIAKNIWGKGNLSSTAPTLIVAKKEVKTEKPVELTGMASVIQYLASKTFVSASGTEVKITQYANTYQVLINGSPMFFNLEVTVLNKYSAVIRAESSTNNDMVKIYVDSRNHTLKNGTTVYSLRL